MSFQIFVNACVVIVCLVAAFITGWTSGFFTPWPMAVWVLLMGFAFATGLLKYLDPPPPPPGPSEAP